MLLSMSQFISLTLYLVTS